MEEVDPDDEPRTFRQGTHRERLDGDPRRRHRQPAASPSCCSSWSIAGGPRVPTARAPPSTRSSRAAPPREAGLQHGDRIVGDRRRSRSTSWDAAQAGDRERTAASRSTLTVERDGEQVEVEATPKRRQSGQGFLGVAPGTAFRDVGVLEAVPRSFKSMGTITTGIADVLGDLFSPSGVSRLHARTSPRTAPKAGSQRRSQPPAVARRHRRPGQRARRRTTSGRCCSCSAHISLILAVFNLLPVLPFDGGHAVDRASTSGSRRRCKHRRVDGRLPQAASRSAWCSHPDPVRSRCRRCSSTSASSGSSVRRAHRAARRTQRRVTRQIHVGRRRGGRRRAGDGAVDDHHEDGRRRRHARADLLARRRRLRHRALHVQRGSRRRGAGADRAPLAGAAHRRHPLPVQARARGDGGGRRRACGSTRATSASPSTSRSSPARPRTAACRSASA